MPDDPRVAMADWPDREVGFAALGAVHCLKSLPAWDEETRDAVVAILEVAAQRMIARTNGRQ